MSNPVVPLDRRMPPCAACGHGWPLHVIPGGVDNLDIYPVERHCVDCACRNYVQPPVAPDDTPTRLQHDAKCAKLIYGTFCNCGLSDPHWLRAEVSRLQQENALLQAENGLLKRSLGILERTISEAEGR